MKAPAIPNATKATSRRAGSFASRNEALAVQ
jgi:hypothetical protein